MANDSLLDEILSIIKQDVKKIKQVAKDSTLDNTQASNLVNYAKLQIAMDKHNQQLEELAKKQELQQEEYEELKKQAIELLKQSGVDV